MKVSINVSVSRNELTTITERLNSITTNLNEIYDTKETPFDLANFITVKKTIKSKLQVLVVKLGLKETANLDITIDTDIIPSLLAVADESIIFMKPAMLAVSAMLKFDKDNALVRAVRDLEDGLKVIEEKPESEKENTAEEKESKEKTDKPFDDLTK